MDAFEKIKEIFRNVPEMLKCCFASTFIVGLIVHLFAFTNMWFISDAAFIYYPAGSTSGIGGSRYLVNLTYLALENIQLPWMAGILEMIIYSFASYYTCRTLNIRHNITAVFIAALMISSPTAIASNTLLSGVLQFSLALFTSVLAAWYLDQGRIGCFMSVLMILIMFGLYGGYIGMTASLLLLVSIRKILEKQDVKSVFLYDVKAVFSIVFGLTGS